MRIDSWWFTISRQTYLTYLIFLNLYLRLNNERLILDTHVILVHNRCSLTRSWMELLTWTWTRLWRDKNKDKRRIFLQRMKRNKNKIKFSHHGDIEDMEKDKNWFIYKENLDVTNEDMLIYNNIPLFAIEWLYKHVLTD